MRQSCKSQGTSRAQSFCRSTNLPPPPQHRMSPPPFCVVVMLLVLGFSSSQRVDYLPGFTGKLPFQLETGYIGVGKSEEIQTFYYFIESERSPEDDPLLLWIEGGAGCSGFTGLVYEIGPLIFDYGNFDGDTPKLIYNPYSWTKVANIIFIDQPVGAGFSYANNSETYKCNDTLIGRQIYEFLRKWLINHPKFLRNSLYVAGESHSGISLPLVVNEIYNGIDAGSEPHLNMKGYILGNPVTDLFGDYNGRIYYAYRKGLLSDELYMSAKENCKGNYLKDPDNDLCRHDLERMNRCVEKINICHILEPWCDLDYMKQDMMLPHVPLSYEEHSARFLQAAPLCDSESWCRSINYLPSHKWANIKLVQEALHVREAIAMVNIMIGVLKYCLQGTVSKWVRCNLTTRHVSYTFDISSTVSYHKKFTHRNDCRALILSGDHDMAVPHTATEEWIRSLKLLIRSDWRPWFVEGQIAGYTTAYFNNDYEMTYATVKGAGHTPPEYKPKECFSMVDRWFSHSSL